MGPVKSQKLVIEKLEIFNRYTLHVLQSCEAVTIGEDDEKKDKLLTGSH